MKARSAAGAHGSGCRAAAERVARSRVSPSPTSMFAQSGTRTCSKAIREMIEAAGQVEADEAVQAAPELRGGTFRVGPVIVRSEWARLAASTKW